MTRHVLSSLHAAAALASLVVAALLLGSHVTETPASVTERVSVDSDGNEANGTSLEPAISADGRYVAFESGASYLVPGDTNGYWDIFVHDREAGDTERVSVESSGEQANDSSFDPAISADGAFIAFTSAASNLVRADTNGKMDIFVHDRHTAMTERVSVDSKGVQGNNDSVLPAISADGRFVAFASGASNLVPGDTNGKADIFVHDRQTGMTERVSVDSVGTQSDDHNLFLTISADGRFVAFESAASNLVPGDTNGALDIFVHDRRTGATERVSVDGTDTQGNGASTLPAISGDGRFVAFQSAATNLVPDDTNGSVDVFVRDRQTDSTERVSVDSSGNEADHDSGAAAVSTSGRFVAFSSGASNLVTGATCRPTPDGDPLFPLALPCPNIFVRDQATGVTVWASVASDGGQPNSFSLAPAISADGRFVAFQSDATNLVEDDTNGFWDVFVRSLSAPPDCLFQDERGNGTTLSLWGNAWTFTGPGGFEASGTGARRLGNRVVVSGRSGDILVAGTGLCPAGPGYFSAIQFRRPPAIFRLMDHG